jgi:hypothetical protein
MINLGLFEYAESIKTKLYVEKYDILGKVRGPIPPWYKIENFGCTLGGYRDPGFTVATKK